MANTELLAKIKTEVERLKPRIRKICGKEVKIPVEKVREKFDTLLSFISALESENTMNQDGLEDEIKKEILKLSFFIRGKDLIAFARHFAEWGAEHLRK